MKPLEPLQAKSEADIREELRGFPEDSVAAILRLRENFTAAELDVAMRHVLAFYLPKERCRSLDDLPAEARLREDLGVDSLTMAEAAFKFDELLGAPVDVHDTANVHTLGDLHALLKSKLAL
jgi:acyl carrier protein